MQTVLLPIIVLLAVLVGLLLLAYQLIFRRPLPRLTGELTVVGLEADLVVERDHQGIPSVRAASRRDACLAVGFVHGQDRLWQMEVQRRLAAGRLAEVLGPRALPADRLMRRLGLRRVSEAEWHITHAAGPVREELQAYADGVNAAIADRPLPAEFTILRHRPEPWEPEDTLAVGRLLSFSQSGNWEAQLLRMRMLKELGPAAAAALDPVLGALDAAGRAGLAQAPGGVTEAWMEELAAAEDLLELSSWAPASNSWVVHGRRTTTGTPLLANDPHAPISVPSPWYRVRVSAAGEDLAGLTFSGTPYVLLGQNRAIAWGMVNSRVSIQDLYVERFNPNNPLQFDDHGSWQDAVRFREVIRVRGARPVQEDVLVTRRGPIISPALEGKQPPMSLRWTGFDSEVDSIGWARRLNLASDWKTFRAAISSCPAPAMGVTYADSAGNIGYRLSGFLPVRRKGQGRVPSRGWAREDEWLGFFALDEMPEVFNPPSGVVVAANQPLAADKGAHPLVVEPAGEYRAGRILEILNGPVAVSPQACATLQGDVVSLAGQAFVAVVADASRRFAGERPEAAIALLGSWDGRVAAGEPAAALYARTCAALVAGTTANRMSPALWRLAAGSGTGRLGDDGPFGGHLSGAAVRRASELVEAGTPQPLWHALEQAWSGLVSQLGADPARWSLQREKRFTIAHPLGDSIPSLRSILNRGPFVADGDADTVCVGTVSSAPAGGRLSAAYYRAVYDVGDPANSAWAATPGQSGHPASANYADTIDEWLRAGLSPVGPVQDAAGGRRLVLRKPV